MCAFTLFLIPSRSRPGESVLTYEMTKHLPWDIIAMSKLTSKTFETSAKSGQNVQEVFKEMPEKIEDKYMWKGKWSAADNEDVGVLLTQCAADCSGLSVPWSHACSQTDAQERRRVPQVDSFVCVCPLLLYVDNNFVLKAIMSGIL